MFRSNRASKSGIFLVLGIFVLGALVLGGFFYAARVIRRMPSSATTVAS